MKSYVIRNCEFKCEFFNKHLFFSFFFASMAHVGENDKIRLGDKADLDGVLNSELLRIAVGNKICEKHPDSNTHLILKTN